MKKILLCLFLFSPWLVYAQIGVKAGLNFADVSSTSSISYKSQTGYNIGIFLAPKSKRILSSKTELILSKQGYNYATNSQQGTADLLYIMLPTYMCINITRFFQIHVGAQMAYLINAKADDKTTGGTTNPISNAMQYYNRFDYGVGGGLEIHPFKGLLVGSRINISLANLYKDALNGQMPSFASINVKQNLFQIYTGWHFGK
jgi:opacity protein-like surface antigen